jgi:hypothetical protein
MNGMDKIIIRAKGNGNKEMIKSLPAFVLTRRSMSEF